MTAHGSPRTLIFDLDGTLTDPREGIVRCYIHAMEKMGRPAPARDSLERYIGPPIHECARDLLGTDDAGLIQEAIAHFRQRFGEKGFAENTPYEGIRETLEALKARGHRMLVCTSKPRHYALMILDHFGLKGFFEAVYGAEMDGTRGDKRELLAHLLEQEKLDGAACVMIGDRMHDARAALANGARSLGVLYGFGDLAELREAGVHAICETPAELIAAIERLDATVAAGAEG